MGRAEAPMTSPAAPTAISVADLGSYLSRLPGVYVWADVFRVNIVFTLVPIAVTATTMAIEIPAAIGAYSMAVAPVVSFRNRRSIATFPL